MLKMLDQNWLVFDIPAFLSKDNLDHEDTRMHVTFCPLLFLLAESSRCFQMNGLPRSLRMPPLPHLPIGD